MSTPSLHLVRPPLLTHRAAGRAVLAIAALATLVLAPPADAWWKRDRTAPQTTITAQPAATTTSTSASFSFSSSEASSFECKLDAAAFASCVSPKSYSSLSVGSHTFQVRAKDRSGNVDATPASYTWQVTAPSPTPTPTPTPAPGSVLVPTSIPADCSRNVQVELSDFINKQPSGTTVEFPANGCYAQNDRIEVRYKSGLTIDGNGSSFKGTMPNSNQKIKPNWLILKGTNIHIKDMKIVGNFHLTGTRSQQRVNQISVEGEAGATTQPNAGINFSGGDTLYATDLEISDVFGDGIQASTSAYVDWQTAASTPTHVHIERVKAHKTARMCFAPTQAIDYWLVDSQGSDCWYGAFDAESDESTDKLQGIHVIGNTFWDYNMVGIVVPVARAGDNTRDIEIRNNTLLTRPDSICAPLVQVGAYPNNPDTIQNVKVENNTFNARSGIGVKFDHVVGGSIQNNKVGQYMEAGCMYPAVTPFTELTNSSSITVAGNG